MTAMAVTFALAAAAIWLPGLIDKFAGCSIEEHVSAALDEPVDARSESTPMYDALACEQIAKAEGWQR